MTVLHIPSHGLPINGVVYQAAGAGLHPTIVICHGLPGNEKNLDLAQAVRRAGWNAVTFNYRGSWAVPATSVLLKTSKTPPRFSSICERLPTLPLWESTRAGLSSRATVWAVG
jgi:predicted alpha/beta-fold hydrolase